MKAFRQETELLLGLGRAESEDLVQELDGEGRERSTFDDLDLGRSSHR